MVLSNHRREKINWSVKIPIEALIVENITSPDTHLDEYYLSSFANKSLADPNFHLASQIDDILGVAIFS